MAFMEEFKHLEIQLKDIISATKNFDKTNLIGGGGFGPVYKGELSHVKGQGVVAIKRLDRKYGQGNAEFLKEITMLSRYTHENLISLLGFCNEDDEKILVYEYAAQGSLDRHLNAPSLTWRQRLKICFEAAKGLSYLHDPRETHQRVLHCDIKSANILLDDKWNAKLSDFGLSKSGPANQEYTFLVTNAVGTFGYCDPMYLDTGLLTKESDVYSFGVLLFEVLCGKLCYIKIASQVQILVPIWKQSYDQKKLHEIISEDLMKQEMDPNSLKFFSDIAYRCLKRSREERPTMAEVVTELQIALESQEISEGKVQLYDYEEMARTAAPPLKYRSLAELNIKLSNGVLLNGGKTWFSVNMNGEHCEMISIAECLNPLAGDSRTPYYTSQYNSSFPVGSYDSNDGKFRTHVRTQFLSPSITYAVNLVFKKPYQTSNNNKQEYVGLKYRLEGETKTSTAHLADEREDGWLMVELYQFTSNRRIVDLEIIFNGIYEKPDSVVIEGVEFCPMEIAKHQVLEDVKVDMQPISDSDAHWEQKLPNDYEDIIKWSKDSLQWTTKKELYSILCKGFLMNDGQEWFSLDKNGKKCQMLSATAACVCKYKESQSPPESRFGEVVVNEFYQFGIVFNIKSQVLSPQTTYATYLVYKLPQDHFTCEAPVKVGDEICDSDDWNEDVYWFIYMLSPQTPVIRPKVDQNTHSPLNRPKIKSLPKQRSDGWMEVQVWEFRIDTTTQMIPMKLHLESCDLTSLDGVIIQGIEFRPI